MTDRSTEGTDREFEALAARSDLEPSTRVAYRLAEETDRSIDELRPLAESVDPEALDSIFRDRSAPEGYVTFQHEGYAITVTGAGEVLVDPLEER